MAIVNKTEKAYEFTQEEMAKQAILLLNKLKSSINCDGIKLEFNLTKSWSCSYNFGSSR
ncbi:unnamed protein product, partial [marine sediment metagenome]